jgi:hypothetical protein
MDASTFDFQSEISVGNFRCRLNIRTVSDDRARKQISVKQRRSSTEKRCVFHFSDFISNDKARNIHTVTELYI